MSNFLNADSWDGKLFGGQWIPAKAGKLDVLEPATGHVLTSVGNAAPADVVKATADARQAQLAWVAKPYEERAVIFRAAARLIGENMVELTDWIVRETGSIPPKAQVELNAAIGILHEAAAMLTQPHGLLLPSNPGRMSIARRLPHGVVGVISPFNFPLILSIRAVAPALATGNTVVLKPDPQTPVTGGFLIARIFQEAGLPEGCLHVLPGDGAVGAALVTDPNVAMISFTGSTAAGRKVGELAGRHLKKVTLELGGKNSLIVLDDADIDIAASNAAWGAYLHQGQICMSTGRILAHKNIAESLTAKLAEKANHLPVGNPATGQVALGPIISKRQLDHVDGIVKDTVAAGAKLRAGGSHEGLFYRPTVLEGVKPGMRSFEEEVFGPVASVIVFDSDDEALALANNTAYGLSAGIISKSYGRAMSLANKLNCGLIHINDQTVADEPHIPFGGRGASGNGGRHGGPANWEEFTQWQWITIREDAHAYPF